MQSSSDEMIGQLVAVIHNTYPRAGTERLRVQTFRNGAEEFTAVNWFPVSSIIQQWVVAFHCALYRSFPALTQRGRWEIFDPLPDEDEISGVAGRFRVPERRFKLVKFLKAQRCAGKVDRVVTNNGKCEYLCTWNRASEREWWCTFGLRLYSWEELGDPRGGSRGCVGTYSASLPVGATCATELIIPTANFEPLDPFGR